MWKIFLERFLEKKWAIASAIFLFSLFIASLFAPYFCPYEPLAIEVNAILMPPSLSHPLGTDMLGRDVLSRLIFGARISLKVGFVAVGIATVIGTMIISIFISCEVKGKLGTMQISKASPIFRGELFIFLKNRSSNQNHTPVFHLLNQNHSQE